MTYPMAQRPCRTIVLWVRDELFPYRHNGRVVVAYEDSGVQLRYPGSKLPLIAAGGGSPINDAGETDSALLRLGSAPPVEVER